MKDARPVQWAIERRATVLGLTFVIFAVGAAALMAARHPSQDTVAATQAQAESHALPGSPTQPDQRAFAATPTDGKKAASPRASATLRPANALVPHTTSPMPVVEPLSPLPVTTATEPLADSSKSASSAESTPVPAVQKVASVTITGCLEHDDEAFWLSDTSGAAVPMSRSWRSAFLKKRPSRIELVDAAHVLKLTSYVGQRIAATGTIVKGEMQTRSLHRVAASCS